MKIELLYFSGCPSWQKTQEDLNEIIERHHYQVEVVLIEVETMKLAKVHQFYGSPTIKVNGRDLFPIEQAEYHLGCRVYHTPLGFKGSPPKEMIEEKLSDYLYKETN